MTLCGVSPTTIIPDRFLLQRLQELQSPIFGSCDCKSQHGETPAELGGGRRRDTAFLQSHQIIGIHVIELLIIKSIRNELEIHDVRYRRRFKSG